jgi:hypothetical protein
MAARVQLNPFLLGVSGTIGGLTFSTLANGTIVYSRPYKPQIPSALRTLMLSNYKAAKALALSSGEDLYDLIAMQLELYPSYVVNASNFSKSVYTYISEFFFYELILNVGLILDAFYSLTPGGIFPNQVARDGDSLWLSTNGILDISHENCVFYVSKPYPKRMDYLSSLTSFMLTSSQAGESFDITAAYVARYGAVPEVGSWVCVTTTYFDFTTAHVLPDKTEWFQVV